MSQTAAFELALDQAWRQLERRIRLLRGFGFIVFFVRDARLAIALKSRMADWLSAHHESWADIGIDQVDAFSQRSLAALFEQLRAGPQRLAWLDAQRGGGQAAWDEQRRELLGRLNERRSRLEAELPGPLILLLPVGAQRDAAIQAPDLWHVRVLTLQLESGLVLDPPIEAESSLPDRENLQAPPMPGATGSMASLRAWQEKWRKLLDGVRDADSDAVVDGDSEGAFSYSDAHAAIAEAVEAGLLEAGRALAESCLRVGRRWRDLTLRQQQSNAVNDLADALSAIRRLGFVLDDVGAVAQAQGDWARTGAVYEESLQLRRDLVQRLGGTPQALRDLSVSLNNIGRVARAQGDWVRASAVYEESLQLRRDLVQQLGGTPQALRDLSVSLNNIGRVARAQGDWGRAGAVYEESLQLRRDLVQRLGGTPEALRDLSVSLDNIGRMAQAQGDWARASAVYEESLQLSRDLVQRLGGTPEALRDLSISLNNIGQVAQAQGDWARASAVYEESLQLSRDLVQRLGGTPEALRDLSVSLNNIGQVARAQGDWVRASAVYEESLQLRRDLVQRLGGTPEALRDLSVSLDNIGQVARAQGDWVRASAVYEESLQLSRDLVQRLGGTPEALDDLGSALLAGSALPAADQALMLAEAEVIYTDLVGRFPQHSGYAEALSACRSLQSRHDNTNTETGTPE